jgi:integral membrane sensor domain MASE1
MAHRLWSIGIAGLALGSLAMVGGTVVGGDLGPLAVGYGILAVLSAAWLLGGMLIRERPWRRVSRPLRETTKIESLAGRRVF